MRVAFLGSPPFAIPVFERLCAAKRHSAVLLVTPPDRPRGRGMKVEVSPLVSTAREHDVAVLQPERARGAEFIAAVRAHAPDALLVASYGEILKQDVLDLAPRGCFNVHASLLPRHRGASPIQAALLAGDHETGVAIQRMVLALDEGDVVHSVRTMIGARETAGELVARLAVLGADAALEALDMIEDGRAQFTPQDAARATYAKKIKKEDGLVDWSRSVDVVDRHVRAMTPWPGARTFAPGGAELTLVEVTPHPERVHSVDPGTLIATGGTVLVACARGALEILALKPAGKGRMNGADWLRGARLEPGARFGVAT